MQTNQEFRCGQKRRAGFTLIELLVVVVIIGILLAVALPLYLNTVKTSSTRTVAGNIRTIANAAQAYYVKGGSTGHQYPTQIADIVGATKDLESAPLGPKGVTYGVVSSSSGAPCVVWAKENGDDAFDDGVTTNGTSDDIYYNLTTQKYYYDYPTSAANEAVGSGF